MEPTQANLDKYKHFSEFYKLENVEERGEHRSLTFSCQKCLPKIQQIKVLSNAFKSNLKRHVQRAHSSYLMKFEGLKPDLKRHQSTTLGSHLGRIGLKQSSIDPCLYHLNDKVFIAVYVDDILLAGRAKDLEMVKRQIASRFEVVDGGPLKHLLGINVVQNKDAGTILIGQSTFCRDLLQRYGFKDCRLVDTPVALETKLVKNTGRTCEQGRFTGPQRG